MSFRIVSQSRSIVTHRLFRRSSVSSSSSKATQSSDEITTHSTQTPTIPQALGFGGALPFLAGAFVTSVLPDISLAVRVTQLYGASILSFLGGVHWGLALRNPTTTVAARDFTVSVVPSLVAWGAAVAPPHQGLAVLSSSFVALFVYDRFRLALLAQPIPKWYFPMRLPLTVAAAGGCGVAWLAVRRQGEDDDLTNRVESSQDHSSVEVAVEDEIEVRDITKQMVAPSETSE